MKEKLFNYAGDKILIEFYNDEHIAVSTYGILYFGDDDFFVYVGGETPFGGLAYNYKELEDLLEKQETIPYENVITAYNMLPSGFTVSDHLKSVYYFKYQELNSFAHCNKIVDRFKLIPIENDHSGMVYNPYSNSWHWL
jgi:hypothetical protein